MIHLEVLIFAGLILAMIVFLVSFIITESALTSFCSFGFILDVIVAAALVIFLKAEPNFYSTEILKLVQPINAVTIENGIVTYNNLQDGQRYSTSDYTTANVDSTAMKEFVVTKYRGIGFVICNVNEIEVIRRFE